MDEYQIQLEYIEPKDIEARSMELISRELGDVSLDPKEAPVIKRVIHTTADFDYLENLKFTPGVVDLLRKAISDGTDIVTDTQMAKAGINKKKLGQYGGSVYCFMSDPDVAREAKERHVTRAAVSMEKAAQLSRPVIFAIGNAPTALIRLHEMMENHEISPVGIIGVPVGFVNVVAAKELILKDPVPSIVARGRKGGSNVAAAIVNSLLYGM